LPFFEELSCKCLWKAEFVFTHAISLAIYVLRLLFVLLCFWYFRKAHDQAVLFHYFWTDGANGFEFRVVFFAEADFSTIGLFGKSVLLET
jgi:hypothetical protein